jgi:NADPH-dependent 2,4-dienoyl-CoA reductase/sulfur reductase-like enzyme
MSISYHHSYLARAHVDDLLRRAEQRPAHRPDQRPRVVIVGGGFGGLQAAQHLARLSVDVTLIDRRNFHLFQPLAYQVATGALSPAEISYPLRRIFRHQTNVRVLLAEVTDIDLDARQVMLRAVAGEHTPESVGYDTLIVSAGSRYNYFGHDEWQTVAPNLKTLEGALAIRRKILEAFEAAELEPDPTQRAAWLTFVIVGAGPTGVEMAGQIAEIARDLRGDFRSLDPSEARIMLVEAGHRVLAEFPPSLSRRAMRSLARMGVTTVLERAVVDADDEKRPRRGRSSGPLASLPRPSRLCSPSALGSTWIALGASRSCPTCRSRAIPRCWPSGTWFASVKAMAPCKRCRGSRRSRCNRAVTPPGSCAPILAADPPGPSATATRATWLRSVARAPWRRSSASG